MNIEGGMMIKMYILLGALFLAASCASLPAGNDSEGFLAVDSLSSEDLLAIRESGRHSIEIMLGQPHRTHSSDIGTAYEYVGEEMHLHLIFSENGDVKSMSYTAAPEYLAEILGLDPEETEGEESLQDENGVEAGRRD